MYMYVDIIFLLQFLNAVIVSNLLMKISKKLGMCVTSTSYLAVVKIRCASNCNNNMVAIGRTPDFHHS